METVRPHTLDTGAPSDGTMSVSCRTFPADRTAPRAAAAWLRGVSTGLSSSRLTDAELCMDELVTNVVRHAWTDADSGPRFVTVRIDRVGAEVEITVEDAGRPFDPKAEPLAPIAQSLEDALPGGRGLLLVRSIASRLTYQRSQGVNRTTIAFPADGSPGA